MRLDNDDKTSVVDVIVRVISFGFTEISKISNDTTDLAVAHRKPLLFTS